MRYDSDLLYRPPGEWKSYLLQCTIGCSNNQCTFCGMYKEKKFRIRPVADILEDIDMARDYYGPELRRVFLMDGDAIIMKTEELLQILHKLYDRFPKLEKVTLYAGPKSTLSKTPEELKALHEAGLSRAYLGVESGSELLDTVSRSSAWIEKRPHSARLHGCTRATGYYNFRSYGQGCPLEREGFF